jgi:ABC-type uncharacterized transport system ATPase subunit
MIATPTLTLTQLAATSPGGRRREQLQPAVSVHGLRRSYGSIEAVRGIDFEIARGEIFALLGPNGAGKTTTLGAPVTATG